MTRYAFFNVRPFLVAAALVLGLALQSGSAAASFETKAEYAVLMDGETGAILYEKRGDELMSPSSMSKLMTMTMLFEAMEEGRVTLEDEFVISENAWRKGGAASGSSTMFADVNSRIKVKDLIRGVIVQSGNDACIAIAEGLAGSEAAFAERMTERARELGMEKSTFANATGWPDPNHKMTAEELAILARHMIYDLAEYYFYYDERSFTWNGITQSNRNPLLYMNIGADGLKTGHTEEAGYGLTASAERNGRRLIMVVNGLGSERERAEESERFLDWGFREFKDYELYASGSVVENADVFQGVYEQVPLVVKDEVNVIMSRDARKDMKVTANWDGPLLAPIEAGTEVGTLSIEAPNMPARSFPLYAGATVEQQGLFGRAFSGLQQMIMGQ
ncbi:D-alanyl-D-alanine carboxypeptidase family protein [Tepidicaulis sp. LMO-SS28]|uniref:D-alanyl-D-alanine carboxypeptidase family protein n=1 Tax=Tepidicaulis sp. LMO-SS28 TaxID=3447455 RepID=UPI003EDF8D1B